MAQAVLDNSYIKSNKQLANKILNITFGKVLPYLMILVLAVRVLSVGDDIADYVRLNSLDIPKRAKTFSFLAIWMFDLASLCVILRSFFNFNAIKNLGKWVAPIYILNIICLNNIMTLYNGGEFFKTIYIVEIIIGLMLCIYNFVNDGIPKFDWKKILINFGVFLLLMIPAMPVYMIQSLFGMGSFMYEIKDLTEAHRVFLYIGIIIPVVLYFCLRNKSQEVVRFSLIYISLATMIGFIINYSFASFKEPWTLPLHLCNTAMFIVPLCLIFKMKRLFYFTYFINVFGAIIAMLMPNYSASTNIYSAQMIRFWYNHWIAYFMPLLCVALKEFERPKLKQFIWSMVGFLVYFIFALFFNVYFSALGHEVDYFFLNSPYVGEQLGKWAENLFNNFVWTVDVKGLTLTFHPLYQFLFFLSYIGIGIVTWFVYGLFFRIADNHYELYLKLKTIKQAKIARLSVPTDERKEELMNSNIEARLELKHFSKKYATSKVYAVEDANLEVFAGEIFGFLGPNGAGKSTIIKSLVGIQPITEGNMEICGFDVTTQSVDAKYHLGFVPDHYALYEKLTGREYINYIADIYGVPKEERDARLEKYIEIFELAHSIDSKIRTYSHGMKQKVTIMAALVHNPKVWILDEPLTGLDPNSIYQVKECMKQHAAEGNIVFFSSHIIDIVEKLCGRIAIIKKGKIQCVKTIKEIEESGYTLEEFYLKTIEEKKVAEPVEEAA